ncbi:MAG: glycoside hydrolase family 38 C-terminal domain-containing protein, partial [Vicinamibacteria bacterium]
AAGAAPTVHETPHLSGHSIENELLRVDVNADGTLNILDKRSGKVIPHVLELEDVGDVGDEYSYSPPAKDRLISNRHGAKALISVISKGDLRQALRIDTSIAVPSSAGHDDRRARGHELVMTDVELEVGLSQGSPVVSCSVKIENRASDHRLRLLFPTGADVVRDSRADTAFGVVARAAKRAQPPAPIAELPVSSYPMQSFVDAGHASAGITVLSEGLMEFEVVGGEPGRHAAIALTLIRSVGWLSRGDLATRRGNAGPSLETPGAQCLGSSSFRFAFAPRLTPPTEAELCAQGRAFLAPPAFVQGTNAKADSTQMPKRHSFLQTGGVSLGDVVVSALKKADDRDAVVIRLFNPGDVPVQTQMNVARTLKSAHVTNLREQRLMPLTLQDGGVTLILGPRKIKTIELE